MDPTPPTAPAVGDAADGDIPQPGDRRAGLAAFLVVTQVLWVAFLPLWFLALGVVVMGSAAGTTLWLNALLFAIMAYPLALGVAVVGSWVTFVRGRRRAPVWWNLIPLLWVLPLGTLFLVANLA